MRLNRAAANASARIAQSGVECEENEPSAAVEACLGKSAGDVCTVTHDERSFTGQCATTPRGVLACLPPIPEPPPPAAVAACEDKVAGDACEIVFRDDDDDDDERTVDGICRSFASGVVACVPASHPLQRLIEACEGIDAGGSCSFTRDGETVNGTCTALDELGGLVVCVPQEVVPPFVTACEGKSAGDECSFVKRDETISGACVALPDHDILVCQPSSPESPVNACIGRVEGDDCSFTHDDEIVSGICVALPFGENLLACVPDRLVPPRITACADKSAGEACSFDRDGRTIDGNCAVLPDHMILVCQPPPPQVLIDACTGKGTGDACSVMLHDRTFTGVCETAPDGVTLACLPQREDKPSPRVTACIGKEPGALCSVEEDDDEGQDADNHDDDGEDEAKRGVCRPNDEGVLACLPPAPPQEAVDACSGLMVGDMCSFPWGDQILSGACRALPGGATLVCAPFCPLSRHR